MKNAYLDQNAIYYLAIEIEKGRAEEVTRIFNDGNPTATGVVF